MTSSSRWAGRRTARWAVAGALSVSLMATTAAVSGAEGPELSGPAGTVTLERQLEQQRAGELDFLEQRPLAPGAVPFRPEQILRPFISDIPSTGAYLQVIDAFGPIRDYRPDLIECNLNTVVNINNSADAATQERAIFDNYADRLISVTDGLGTRGGQEFRAALEAGELPKVAALLEGSFLYRAGGLANSTLLEKQLFDNPRPFVVAPQRIQRYDRADGDVYSSVEGNGSYPSGHTAQAYLKGILFAQLFPEAAPQILARAAEVGNSRLVLGVHYPMDVIGGRMLAQVAAADRLNDAEFRSLLNEAKTEARTVLERRLGAPLGQALAGGDQYRLVSGDTYREWLTYGFPHIHPERQNDIPAAAAVLLLGQFPHLNAEQRLQVLRATAIEPGHILDKEGPLGGWNRIDLYRALSAQVAVNPDGSVAVS